jgi:sigma-E factor negative regulatory protein RseA
MVMDRISALMDGELDDKEAQSTVMRLKTDAALRGRWDEFHVVRDAMRGEPLLSADFGAKLSRRLADEPTVLAPYRKTSKIRRVTTYAMSAAASLSAAAFVAWVALSPNAPSTPVPGGPIAATPNGALQPVGNAAQQPEIVPYDRNMNGYLLAHEAAAPGNVQRVAPLIRTISMGSSERR